MKERLIFRPRARLLLQLGDQLIRNENVALLELVKNSYDADATHALVIMERVDNPEKGVITVEDDGTGMDMDIIKNVWMEPGSDYKEKLCKESNRTKKFKRFPLGEKGIGRFAVHKLGNVIELVTRKSGHKEIYLKIDWNVFKESNYLEEVPIEISEREPQIFKNGKTGTRITIKKLKRTWTKLAVREFYRSLNSICFPFNPSGSFRVNFEIDKKEWVEGLLSLNKIGEYALFKFKCEIEGQFIKRFTYKFIPWPSMTKLRPREVTEDDEQIKKLLRMVDKQGNPIDLSKFKIGRVRFEGLIFDRDPRILELGVQDKKGLRTYLNKNGGIRVYRDGIRVYDYGEPENDWLSLDIRRVNIPAKRISNNIIIATVSINREQSRDLIEKTNREGFIENEAYSTFQFAILYALNLVETQRETDKEKIRIFYGATPRAEPVVSKIDELRTIVKKKIKDEKLRDEVERYLDRIENNYKYMNEVLLRSAGAGLSLSVVIHEVEKIVGELKEIVKKEGSSRIVTLVKHLSQMIEGYTLIIRKGGKKKWNLKRLIDQAIFNMEFRFKAHKIEIIKDYVNFKGNSEIECAKNLIIGTLMNIMDNSIWWLEYGQIENKKILIKISEELPGYTSVLIADNGPGFSLPTEEVTKPFVSAKPDGMGLGLHIAKEVMLAHKGNLIFPEWGEFTIPHEFKNGAIIIFAFRKEKEK